MAVPTFFFISGFLFYQKLEKWEWGVWRAKMKSRINTLIVPYLIWNILAFVICTLLAIKTFVPKVWMDAFHNAGGLNLFWATTGSNSPYDFPLWFIRDLIVAVFLSPLLWWLLKYGRLVIVFIVFALYIFKIFPFSDSLSGLSIPFFIFGGYVSSHEFIFIRRLWIRLIVYSLWISLMSAVLFCYGINGVLTGYTTRLLTIVSVFVAFDIAARVQNPKCTEFLSSVSDSSFFIFALHTVVVRDISIRITKLAIPINNHLSATSAYFISSLLTLAICWLLYWILKHNIPAVHNMLNGKIKLIK